MCMWTSLALLSVAAVSTLSFPHPGPPIPEVGTGTRAQFYVLKPDGTFTYGYDTGNGLHETATKLESGDIEGEFGYKNADGEDVFVQYIAGEGGFVPINSLPVDPAASLSSSSSSQGSLSHYSAPVRSAPAPAAPVEIAEIRGGIPGADGSYHFAYDTSSSSRSETADADLNIVGRYSFIADDGIYRSVDYKAGSATGFIAEGDHLPKVSDGDFGALAALKVSASALPPTYSAPSASSVNLAAIKSSSSSSPKSDASYSFSYDTNDSARSESADADLNIVGSYSFTADDGVSRSVNYQAGAETGFIAEGEHLPKPVDALAGAASTAFGNTVAATSYPAPVAFSYQAPVSSLSKSPVALEESVIRGGVPNVDGSYQFSYDTSSSSRSEIADALNSVTGSFGFTADDGVHRSIQYSAGAETGFIAEGAHLPVGPSVPGAESGIPTGRILPILSEEEANALAGAKYAAASSSSSSSYGASAVTKSSNPISSPSDASYSFTYNAGDSSRSESADADLNVAGSYSFTADDGISRSVNYKAGSTTGFVAQGDHLPTLFVSEAKSQTAAGATRSSPAHSYSAPSASVPTVAVLTKSSSPIASASDASYSFSYNTADSTRTETADADLNLIGSYSFIGEDGISRSVTYKAGSATGFIAEGDHLPKPVVADTGSSPSTSYSASATSYTAFASPSISLGYEEALIRSNFGDDGSYSFSYKTDGSSRSETADADLNIIGSYSFTGDDGISRLVNYQAGESTGFVAEGDHLPTVGDTGSSALSVKSSTSSVGSNSFKGYDYSAPLIAETSVNTKSSTPFEQSQVRSTSNGDGSYSFSYDTSSSSHSESADSLNSVTGNFGFVADDGIHRSIEYIAGAETGFIATGALLPIGPAVPGAESGIPIGRILPILSEEDANALSGASAQLRLSDSSDEDNATPSDASYSFSFVSDAYSRNEEADEDGNVKGSYTYTGDDGIIRTVNFVAGSETGFSPEGEYTEAAGSFIPSASNSVPSSASSAASITSYQAPSSPADPAHSYSAQPHSHLSNVATKSSDPLIFSGDALDSIVIGDVNLVHANAEASPTMYGYSFTAI